MSTSSDFGYTPKYVMPIITPPISGSPSSYYSGLSIIVNATNNGNNGITYEITNSTSPIPVFSMVGGIVTFFPNGALMPDGSLSGGQGSLLMKTGLLDQQDLTTKLPLGVPPMTSAIYINIDPTSVRTALTPLVNIVNVRILDKSWSETETSDPATELLSTKQAKYLDRLMLGEKFVPVDGGYQLGELGLNVALNPEFTLKFIDGTAVTNISPVLYIRNMPVFDDPNKWTDHPMITSTSAFTSPLEIYIKFEVWNPSSVDFPSNATYIGVDQNIEVKLMDYDPISGDDELASAFTNANGVVQFSLASLPLDSGGGNPDLYFKIINPTCTAISEFTLPSEWSTANTGLASVTFWNSSDGTPGYFPDFGGVQLGNAVTPITYRIGMDYHLRLKYSFDSVNTKIVPQNIQVDLISDGVLSEDVIATNYTDKNGSIHAITFDAIPGDNMFFRVYFQLEDLTVNMLQTRILFNRDDDADLPQTWDSNEEGENIKIEFLNNSITSLYDNVGSLSNTPLELIFTTENRNYAFLFLKTVRELHDFLFYFTNGAWQGRIMTLDFYHRFFAPTPTSFPNGNIWFTDNDDFISGSPGAYNWWTRATIIHEYSHQIMWQESDYSDGGIAGQFGWDTVSDFDFAHRFSGPSTSQRALTEGWADAIELIFTHNENINFNTLHDSTVLDPNPSDTSTFDKGYYVEGAFASSIYSIFWNYVIGSATSQSEIYTSENGDLKSNNTFMTPSNQSAMSSRFLSMIWMPLQELKTNNIFLNKTSSQFVSYVQQFNSTGIASTNTWYKLRSEFLMWNMASFGYSSSPNSLLPTITSVTPNSGPNAGGNIVGISGTNFFIKKEILSYREVKLRVTIGINRLADFEVNVISETYMEVIAPFGDVGPCDVKIETIVRGISVGYFILNNSYTYL